MVDPGGSRAPNGPRWGRGHAAHYRCTPQGTEVFTDLVTAWHRWLLVKLTDWNCDDTEFTDAVDRVATEPPPPAAP